ncbi:MAG: radical SAM protein, partial [Candidatus Aenigmatarchaeota archaeon]
MGKCKLCGKESKLISSFLQLCRDCILSEKKAKIIALEAQTSSRKKFSLPEKIPRKGILCRLCGNNCKIRLNEKGFCGLVENKDNKLIRLAGTEEKGLCEWYYDEHV